MKELVDGMFAFSVILSVTGVSYQGLVSMANDLLRGAWRLSAVRSLEVVRISGVKMYAVRRSAGGTWFVRCAEVVCFSECPLCYKRNFTL